MRNNGFTLIDLITTLSVLAIILAIGLPNLSSHIQQSRVKTATNSLLEAIQLTRIQAVSSSKRATLRKQNEWNEGWEIFIDQDNNGSRGSNENIVLQRDKLTGVRITANRPIKNYVSYISTGESRNASGTNGGGFQAGTFTVCPTAKGKGVELILARGGRVRTVEISEEKCNLI
jgi:type IV fimbrial biogenesis protein FimT